MWDVSAAKELFVQSNSLVSKAKEEGGLAITRLLWNSVVGVLGVVSAEHNIILHKVDTFQCVKQVLKVILKCNFFTLLNTISCLEIESKFTHLQFVGFSDEILDIVYLGAEDSHLAVATNSTNVALYRVSDMSCTLLRGHTDLVLSLATSRANPKLLVSCAKVCGFFAVDFHNVIIKLFCGIMFLFCA